MRVSANVQFPCHDFANFDKNGPCECQAESSRTRKYCVNFDLCDVEKNADAHYNPLYYSYDPYGR